MCVFIPTDCSGKLIKLASSRDLYACPLSLRIALIETAACLWVYLKLSNGCHAAHLTVSKKRQECAAQIKVEKSKS